MAKIVVVGGGTDNLSTALLLSGDELLLDVVARP
jgi:hypothetical protein